MKLAVAEHLNSHPQKTAADIKVACFGLAFKPDIDDLRESPALSIVTSLAEQLAGQVLAVEPHIESLPAKLQQAGVQLVDMDNALEAADIVVMLVDHRQFKDAEPELRFNQHIVDTKGVWA